MTRPSTFLPGQCRLGYADCLLIPKPGRKSCTACLEKMRKFPSATKTAKSQRARNRTLKQEAFEAYGGARCACCGEDVFDFLTLDHVNNDGNVHQTTPGRRGVRYHQLKQAGWPNDPALQVLCFNCNCGKKINGGMCPHKTRRAEPIVEILWRDAADSDITWANSDDVHKFSQEECLIHSLGFIIAKTESYTTLARDFVTNEGTYGGLTKIPNSMIVEIRTVAVFSNDNLPTPLEKEP
jgi:hypothetical protein